MFDSAFFKAVRTECIQPIQSRGNEVFPKNVSGQSPCGLSYAHTRRLKDSHHVYAYTPPPLPLFSCGQALSATCTHSISATRLGSTTSSLGSSPGNFLPQESNTASRRQRASCTFSGVYHSVNWESRAREWRGLGVMYREKNSSDSSKHFPSDFDGDHFIFRIIHSDHRPLSIFS